MLDKVGWLSVRQLIFYHTALQTHKTITTGKPKTLFRTISSNYPYRTRSAANGQIQQSEDSRKTSFKYRARESYNRVPEATRTGSLETVKRKLKLWVKSNIPID